MSSQLLRVPDRHKGGRCSASLRKKTTGQDTALQEIPSWCINAGQLHILLSSVFPAGEYDVDVDQDVYKIRAPRTISQLDILRFKGS